jgi:hypothetical protein
MKLDWKQIVGTVAPTIATALGGPLAGVAVKTLATQLLGKPDATEADVEAAVIGADPQTLLKLKEIEVEFKKFVVDSGIKLVQIDAEDRANAREREVKTGDSWTPRVLAALVVVGWLAVQWFMLHNIVDQSMRELVARVLGTLDSALMLVLSYYFGSSASGKAKDETISSIAKMP